MNLYLLKNLASRSYEDMLAVVIRAESEAAARAIAFHDELVWEDGTVYTRSSERHEIWLDPALSSCELLTVDGEPGIIIADILES